MTECKNDGQKVGMMAEGRNDGQKARRTYRYKTWTDGQKVGMTDRRKE